MRKGEKASNGNGANLGFEEKLWAAADKLRGHMDAAEYKHVVLGLIFLKYISDAFEELHDRLAADKSADPEDRDEYTAEKHLLGAEGGALGHSRRRPSSRTSARSSTMRWLRSRRIIRRSRACCRKTTPGPSSTRHRLGELINLVGSIGLGDAESRAKDILGRVYEYFLGKFASAEGKGGGEFYTPRSVVRLLVEMIEPYKGRIYDPCCGSGGMFVQSREVRRRRHGGRRRRHLPSTVRNRTRRRGGLPR